MPKFAFEGFFRPKSIIYIAAPSIYLRPQARLKAFRESATLDDTSSSHYISNLKDDSLECLELFREYRTSAGYVDELIMCGIK